MNIDEIKERCEAFISQNGEATEKLATTAFAQLIQQGWRKSFAQLAGFAPLYIPYLLAKLEAVTAERNAAVVLLKRQGRVTCKHLETCALGKNTKKHKKCGNGSEWQWSGSEIEINKTKGELKDEL